MLIELGTFSIETKGFVSGPSFDSTTLGGKRISVLVSKID
jgi:hypothetical protein